MRWKRSGRSTEKICTKWNVQKILQMKKDARLFWRTVLCSGCQKKSWIRLSGMESENVVILARERKYQRLFIIVRRYRKERAAEKKIKRKKKDRKEGKE